MILFLLITLLLMGGCAGNTAKKVAEHELSAPRQFKMVSVPLTINTPQARAEYLSAHFWDNFDFADTSQISSPEITEQAFADYIQILSSVDSSLVRRSIYGLLAKAECDSAMFAHISGIGEHYLYDPNSPMRNEELYIPMLEYIIDSGKVDETMKIRPRELLKMALKNRPGQKSTDFGYVTISGSNGRMYSIKSYYTLLFFNNPGCPMCKQIAEGIVASEVFNKLQQEKKLTVLALYPDKDIAEWTKYAPNIPARWINAHDRSNAISDNELYDLKAIPTLYLLDKEKKVILKDATFETVEAFLRNCFNS